MPETRPRVPGWHPDPDDPSSLRHWDGARWGDQRRPRPSWAPAGPAGPTGPDHGPRTQGSRRRWLLLAAGAVAIGLLVISVPAWLGPDVEIPPRTLTDTTFTTSAEALCAKAFPALVSARPESRDDNGTPAAFAARIDRAADGLAAVAADLRGLPVAGADRAAVERWLADWDSYTAVGHRYADALEAGDIDRSDDLSREGQALAQRVFLFSKGNDMPSCVF